MKSTTKIFLKALLVAAGLGLVGCVGYVDAGPDYYYGHDHWYHDGPWMDGPRGYVGIGIHPVPHHRR